MFWRHTPEHNNTEKVEKVKTKNWLCHMKMLCHLVKLQDTFKVEKLLSKVENQEILMQYRKNISIGFIQGLEDKQS